jgi:hypothetical protein
MADINLKRGRLPQKQRQLAVSSYVDHVNDNSVNTNRNINSGKASKTATAAAVEIHGELLSYEGDLKCIRKALCPRILSEMWDIRT